MATIEIMTATPHALEIIAAAAGTSYGKHDASLKRVQSCFSGGHMSVFEHAVATFRVADVSRACTHQIVRHRLASYTQLSQRYTKVDTSTTEWYVMPESFATAWSRADFDACMVDYAQAYRDAIESGIRPEDARYVLPEATKTEITATMNLREIYHFLDLRQDARSQWEIREVAHELERALASVDDDWRVLMELRGK